MEQPEVIKAIQRRHSQIEVDINELKKDFRKMIVDKSIPLENRWRAFTTASSFLKKHETSCVRFQALDFNKFEPERRETLRTSHIIEWCENADWCTPKMVIEFKEEILSMNLGSWINDW